MHVPVCFLATCSSGCRNQARRGSRHPPVTSSSGRAAVVARTGRMLRRRRRARPLGRCETIVGINQQQQQQHTLPSNINSLPPLARRQQQQQLQRLRDRPARCICRHHRAGGSVFCCESLVRLACVGFPRSRCCCYGVTPSIASSCGELLACSSAWSRSSLRFRRYCRKGGEGSTSQTRAEDLALQWLVCTPGHCTPDSLPT